MEHCKEAKNKCAGATCVNRTSFLMSTENENKLPKEYVQIMPQIYFEYTDLGLSWWSSELPRRVPGSILVRELDPLCCKSEPVCHSEILPCNQDPTQPNTWTKSFLKMQTSMLFIT